jgi:hypothetical protein
MSGASFSPDRLYRYALWRQWPSESPGRTISWVLLNPSTANATQLDTTLERCADYSQRWGFDRMNVVNLYAFRQRYPAIMKLQPDSTGPDNVPAIRRYVIADLRAENDVPAAGKDFHVEAVRRALLGSGQSEAVTELYGRNSLKVARILPSGCASRPPSCGLDARARLRQALRSRARASPMVARRAHRRGACCTTGTAGWPPTGSLPSGGP